jgi:hypothetical protein
LDVELPPHLQKRTVPGSVSLQHETLVHPRETDLISEVHVCEADAAPDGNDHDDAVADEQPGLQANRHKGSNPQEGNGADNSTDGLGQCIERVLKGIRTDLGDEQLIRNGANRVGGVRVDCEREQEDSHASALRQIPKGSEDCAEVR